MRKAAATVDGSLAVSSHTTLAPRFVPILLTGLKAECRGLIEGRRLGHQYDLPELPVDSREAPALTSTRTSTSCGIRAVWISEGDAPGASAPSVTT